MRKLSFLLMFILCYGITQAQNICKVQGVVRYFYNDTFGYKADLGAEVRFIPKTEKDTIPTCEKWEEYETKSNKVVEFLKVAAEWKEEGIYYLGESQLRALHKVTPSDEERVKELSQELFEEVVMLMKHEDNMCLVDNTGMYSIELPKGEYYVVMRSKNRDRPLMAELVGRIYVKEVNLNSSTKVISHDFDL
jgi:hypothetical protein